METTLQGVLRVNEDGWPLDEEGQALQIGAPLPMELSSGAGFEFDGQLTGLDVDGAKIVEHWSYTATSTIRENEEYIYIATKTSRLLPDGRVSMTFTQTGGGFDPTIGQYVTYNQTCLGELSR